MSDGRDLKGRFIKGRDVSKESIETQIKRISSLKESWREREDYISDYKKLTNMSKNALSNTNT